jgi:hypothetical protein
LQLAQEQRLVFAPAFKVLRAMLNAIGFDPSTIDLHYRSRLDTGARLWACGSHSVHDDYLELDYEVPAAVKAAATPDPAVEERMRLQNLKLKELEQENEALKARAVWLGSALHVLSCRLLAQTTSSHCTHMACRLAAGHLWGL